MLAQAEQADVVMAPAADMFEMGVKVQVLKRGTMFAMRAAKLYELYRAYAVAGGDSRRRARRRWRRTCSALRWRTIWAADARLLPAARSGAGGACRARRRSTGWPWCFAGIWACRRAGRTPASRRGKLDYQVWCGPAMGAFNEWVRGSFLERPENRRVVTVALNILYGAAVLLRAERWPAQGVDVPAGTPGLLRSSSRSSKTACSP